MLVKNLKFALLILFTSAVLLVAGFFWNESRKEIKYLCQNFKPGTALADVTRQLDTGNFLEYRSDRSPSGEGTLIVSSPYTAHVYVCKVLYDKKLTATTATYPASLE